MNERGNFGRLGVEPRSDQLVRVVVTTDSDHPIVASTGEEMKDPLVRNGVGCAVSAPYTSESFRSAHIAMAFAADGSDDDPGPRCVRADDLGLLLDLVPILLSRREPMSKHSTKHPNVGRGY